MTERFENASVVEVEVDANGFPSVTIFFNDNQPAVTIIMQPKMETSFIRDRSHENRIIPDKNDNSDKPMNKIMFGVAGAIEEYKRNRFIEDSDEPKNLVCPKCGEPAWHPWTSDNGRYRYCKNCHKFQADINT